MEYCFVLCLTLLAVSGAGDAAMRIAIANHTFDCGVSALLRCLTSQSCL